jgi:hypothetical protein
MRPDGTIFEPRARVTLDTSSVARALAATIGDREGALAPKIEAWLPELAKRFSVFVQATTVTSEHDIAALLNGGAAVLTAEPNFDLIGRHRRQALRQACTSDAERVVYMDIDHALRWIENDPDEFDRVIENADGWDCTVIGRGTAAWHALPDRLARTESVVNHVYELATGRPWDLLMAARSFSRRAAEAIVADCNVDSIGNDVAWPLFCERAGLSIGYVEADGLTYRTNEAYARDLQDRLDHDPMSWARRIQIAWIQVAAMEPYLRDYQPR